MAGIDRRCAREKEGIKMEKTKCRYCTIKETKLKRGTSYTSLKLHGKEKNTKRTKKAMLKERETKEKMTKK